MWLLNSVRVRVLATMVCNFGVEVAHLRVFLDIKVVLHVSANAQSISGIYSDHPGSCWPFEHMQFNQVFLGSGYNSEFTKAHLKHHVFSQLDFLPDHYESSRG